MALKRAKKKEVYTKEEIKNCRILTDLLDPDDDAVQSWRTFRIMSEFVQGFEILRRLDKF